MPSRMATCICSCRRMTRSITLGDIYKTGRVRVALDPNPFKSGKPFRQTLDLPSGSIRIEADGVTLRIWADANSARLSRRNRRRRARSPSPPGRSSGNVRRRVNARDVPASSRPGVRWNGGKSSGISPSATRASIPDDLKFYQVEHMAAKFPDPYRFNTFGNLLESPALTLQRRRACAAGGSLSTSASMP